MIMILFMFIVLGTVSLILCGVSLYLSRKSFMDREKMSPFECGFDPFNSSRLPFSLRFYLIALIFLIFDVEIVLILPMIFVFYSVDLVVWFSMGLIFILILLVGLYYEWFNGALSWK